MGVGADGDDVATLTIGDEPILDDRFVLRHEVFEARQEALARELILCRGLLGNAGSRDPGQRAVGVEGKPRSSSADRQCGSVAHAAWSAGSRERLCRKRRRTRAASSTTCRLADLLQRRERAGRSTRPTAADTSTSRRRQRLARAEKRRRLLGLIEQTARGLARGRKRQQAQLLARALDAQRSASADKTRP